MSEATLVKVALCVLAVVAAAMHRLAKGAESRIDIGPDSSGFHSLQRRYFGAFLLAVFADWLQGPYVYKLYAHYGYTERSIAVLYVVGFLSSAAFGTFVGSLADRLGRRRLCVVYCALYSLCCLTKVTANFHVLLAGRVLGGISTSILFSTFEAWYVHQHHRANYPAQWVNLTMAQSTFYNAMGAILAGMVANTAAETLDWGPVSPFLLAVPCLIAAGLVVTGTWEENALQPAKGEGSCFEALFLVFEPANRDMLKLGAIQSAFESVMYTFVFLWTPVLLPMSPPLGFVFSCFMVCLMVGSSLYSYLVSRGCRPDRVLGCAIALAFLAMCTCTLATHSGSQAPVCFLAFLGYEVSVGMYFPAVGYLRSRVLPERHRAGVTNWFRAPMNLLVCCSLIFLMGDAHTAFLVCSACLVVAGLVGVSFSQGLDKPVDDIVLIS